MPVNNPQDIQPTGGAPTGAPDYPGTGPSFGWFRPLSEPVRAKPRAQSEALALALFAPGQISLKWLQPLSEPALRVARVRGEAYFLPPYPYTTVPPAVPPVVDPLFIATGYRAHLTAGLPGKPQVSLIAGVKPRLVATGRIGMKANDLSPAIAALVETRPITFDFGLQLAIGVTILSATLTAAVHSGAADPTPNNNWQGVSAIMASPATGAASQAVTQQFGLTPGVSIYLLRCSAVCSDGSKPALETTLQSYAPA